MTNRLALESSPYLLQHAHHPVDWYPWCDEAFERAYKEDKPVFLSIGYSSCHWCHVMAHESFENSEIALYLNRHFISIKVDREERPDLDHIYMRAVQSITGSGGWPLTVFLTPDRKPFSGGTYFPPEDRYRTPGFLRVLKIINQAFQERRNDLAEIGSRIEKSLRVMAGPASSIQPASEEILKTAYSLIAEEFDGINGGFGPAPKFPHPVTLEFLLRYHLRFKEPAALEMVEFTLQKMASGGIYDQIGGGFHRYSTDDEWLVPHFEKMLYDNALLSRVYLQAYRVTGRQDFADVAAETMDYVLREMQSAEGGFYSTQDADSEGQEGKFYTWPAVEIEQFLEPPESGVFSNYFGVSRQGNFDGSNILHITPAGPFPGNLKGLKSKLLAARGKRVKPARDEKIIAAWNGLMLTALAEAAVVLERPDYLSAAIANAGFLTRQMISGARLQHVYKDGASDIEGFLDDYAAVIEGLLAVHKATMYSGWLLAAIDLCQSMVQQFLDANDWLYDTQDGQNDLIVRPRNTVDGATPSGVALAVGVLMKMSVISGRSDYRVIAEKNLALQQQDFGGYPLGHSYWLCNLDFHLTEPLEVVIAGDPVSRTTQELAAVVNSRWLPNLILVAFQPGVSPLLDQLPIFAGRQLVDGKTAAYVCRNGSCRVPVGSAADLKNELEE